MDKDQIYLIACVDYKNRYSAPGVVAPGSTSYEHTVGGWLVEQIRDETGEEGLK